MSMTPHPQAAQPALSVEEVERITQMAERWHDEETLGDSSCEFRALEVAAFRHGYIAALRATPPSAEGERQSAALAGEQPSLSDAQCDAIFTDLHMWAMDVDPVDFGLPQCSGGGKEAARDVIRRALSSAPAGEQPADSEHLMRWCQSLIAALKRLSFAAQTTGGTAGPDAELQAAIGQAEEAMSMQGCIAAAGEQGAHAEPVAWMAEDGERVVPASAMETARRSGGASAAAMRSYPIPLYAAPPPSPSQEAEARDAVRYRWLRDESREAPDGMREVCAVMFRAPFTDDADASIFGEELDAAIDAALAAQKKE